IVALLWLAFTPEPGRATSPPRFGPVPQALSQAFESGALSLPPPPPTLRTSTTQTVWKVPVILIDFTDQPLTHTESEFEIGLFDTTGATPTGSVFDYYRWVSGNRIRVIGKVVATWHLSQPKNYYANYSWGLSTNGTPKNIYGAVDEALRHVDASVDFSPFDQDN